MEMLQDRLNEIEEDSSWKRRWSKHPNKIEKYKKGRYAPIVGATTVRKDCPIYIAVLMSSADIDVATAIGLSKVISTIEETTDKYNPTAIRFATGISKRYLALDSELKNLFVEDTMIDKNEDRVEILRFNTDSRLYKNIYMESIEVVELLAKIDMKLIGYINPSEKFYVAVKSFKLMGIQSQITILKNLIEVSPSEGIAVKKNTKQEIANYGRQYNTMNEIYNLDRQWMIGENLFGLDMESAIQVILYELVSRVNLLEPSKKIELLITERFIQNKAEVREEVAELMDFRFDENTLNIPKAKMTITAIYQGMRWNKSMSVLTPYFNEAQQIMEQIMRYTYLEPKSDATKYARLRTNMRLDEEKMDCKVQNYYDKHKTGINKGKWKLSKKQRNQIRKSFTFFTWTWYERQIQDIMTKYVKNPITLHDGIYTQSRGEFTWLRKQLSRIESDILLQTEIPMKLGLES